MRFPYQELEVLPSPATKKKRVVNRPIIPVILIYRSSLVNYQALIDTGSDYNVFEAGVSQLLGLRLTSGHKRQITGIGGKEIKGYEHNVALRIAGKQYRTKVIFSSQIPPYSFGVLGNKGFFDHFKVTFKYPKYIDIT